MTVTNVKNIAVRADAAHWIGSGHIARCATLAEMLRQTGASVHFICRDLPGNYCDWLEQQRFTVHRLSPAKTAAPLQAPYAYRHWLGVSLQQEIDESTATLAKYGPFDWLIVDHYALDQEWERAMSTHARQVMVIDDLADRPHHCNLLIDQNLQSSPDRYKNLLPTACRTLLGPNFALLRPEFALSRATTAQRNGRLHRLLIFMGGSDAENITLKAFNAVAACFPEIDPEIDIVIGAGNPNHQKIAEACAHRAKVHLHIQTPCMAQLMASADIMLGAAGTTSWERCCLGLPAITVSAAANQRENGRLNAANRVALYLGDSADLSVTTLAAALRKLAKHPGLLRKMSARALSLTDGLGASRIALLIGATDFKLRKMTTADCEPIWHWRNDPRTRKTAFNPEEISLESHRCWFERTLNNARQHLLLGCIGNRGIGALRFDREIDTWTISVYLDPDLHGLGLGSKLISAGIHWLTQNTTGHVNVHALLRPENQASRKAFLAAGFVIESESSLHWRQEAA